MMASAAKRLHTWMFLFSLGAGRTSSKSNEAHATIPASARVLELYLLR